MITGDIGPFTDPDGFEWLLLPRHERRAAPCPAAGEGQKAR